MWKRRRSQEEEKQEEEEETKKGGGVQTAGKVRQAERGDDHGPLVKVTGHKNS